jgi:hypothetical protein
LGQPSIVLHAHRFAFGFSHFIFFSFLFFSVRQCITIY